MVRELIRWLFVLVLVVPVAPPVGGAPTGDAPVDSVDDDARPDPDSDVVGWEAGYWYDESVTVGQTDGLNATERDALVARSMARVEYLRDAEFNESVPVTVVSREEYREQYSFYGGASKRAAAWKNALFEALLLVGEDENATAVERRTMGASVGGFYTGNDEGILLVSNDANRPTADPATLVHELVHALQDQQNEPLMDPGDNASADRYRPATWDGERALESVVEGEANYVEALYLDACGEEWSCVPAPEEMPPRTERHRGVLMAHFFPYSDGPPYVHHLRNEGGWAAVDAARRDPPASAEQVIHHTDESPASLRYEDRARGEWRRFSDRAENGTTTLGESAMYAMFWHRSRTDYGGWVDLSDFETPDAGRYDVYDYDAPPTAGWGNDAFVPYRRPTANGTESGYVWVTEWDSPADAHEFGSAYRGMLAAQDAENRSEGLYVVSNGSFADAFRVVRNGTRVTVVNGPDAEAVENLRPGLRPPERESNATTGNRTTADAVDDAGTSSTRDSSTTGTQNATASTAETPSGSVGTDGFGALGAAVALVAFAVAFGRRRRQ